MIVLWIILILIAVFGIFWGMYYYHKPEAVVVRRMKRMQIPLEDKDPQFQKWLRAEFEVQVAKTRKIGKMLTIVESVWLLVILLIFFNSLRS